ncbi:MAG: hypothetical protein U0L92_01955 [Clostridia bacterium]|nr:hypothetical protein [Clostridia bacterium]
MNGKELRQLLKIPRREPSGKKLPHPFLVWGIIGAIVFLALTGFSGEKKETPRNATEETEVQETEILSEDYITRLEERLVKTLSKIDGAGEVSVFVSIESGGEKVLATDIKTESEEAAEENQSESRNQKEESVVLSEKDSGQSPYIIEEKMPVPSGILVIAEGAKNENVKLEIYEAVKALFGLSAHRIKVTY